MIVYCDEAGIHNGAQACAVAGWVTTALKWQDFNENWFKACDGVEWHGHRFFARTPAGGRLPPYEGWDDEQRVDYLSRLLNVITTSDVQAVGGVIDVGAFKSLPLDDRRWLTGATWNNRKQRFTSTGSPNRPYFRGFMECLEGVAMSVAHQELASEFCL